MQRHCRDADSCVRRRVLGREPAPETIEILLHLRQCDPALASCDDVEIVLRAPHAVRSIADSQRRPDSRVVRREGDGRRQHADDRVQRVADSQRPPDHIRVRPEARAPQGVADDRDGLTSRAILFLEESSPEGRLHAEHTEERRRHAGAGDHLLAFGSHELVRPTSPRRDSVERG